MRPSRPACLTFLAAALAFVFCADTAQAAPGDLDLTFGGGTGWKTLPAGSTGAFDAAVQPDGKIVLTGSITDSTGFPRQRLAVWRVLPDGSPDPAFNGTGQTIAALPAELDSLGYAVALQSDGRIVVAGSSWPPTVAGGPPESQRRCTLACFLPDGRPDPSFGPVAQGFHRSNTPGILTDIALQPDGKILAGGNHFQGSPLVWRCLPDGLSDPAFGSSGFAPIGLSLSSITCLSVQRDGKILMGRASNSFAVTRLLPNGWLDPGFGFSNGHALFAPGDSSRTALCRGVMEMPDGRIIAGGEFTDYGPQPPAAAGFIAVRFLPAGTVDPAFGDPGGMGAGRITLPFPNSTLSVTGMRVQSDGRILLAGYRINPRNHFALGRFTADGTADPAFGIGGGVFSTFTGDYNLCYGLALLPDQKLLAVGAVQYTGSSALTDILLARYHVPPFAAMSVEYPAGTNLPASSPLGFGPVTAGARILSIVLKNTGDVALTGLQLAITGESVPGDFQAILTGGATLAPGEQGTINVILAPSAPPGVRTATLNISTTSPGIAPRTVLLTGSKATPLEIWRVTWFGSPDNSGPGADMNDFDHDGLPNFMEYTTRSHPHLYTHDPCRPTGEGGFTYSRPAAALTEFSYMPESAPAPAGPWSASGLTSTVLTDDGTMQTVQVTRSASHAAPPRLFLRLRVTRP